MKESLENAYREFASIAECTLAMKEKSAVMEKLYIRLGDECELFDNLIYERMGMSADEVMEMLDMGDILS